MGLDARMMDRPLSITHLLERARTVFPDVEVVSRRPDRSLVTQTYADTYARAERLARALGRLGVGVGDRVATFAWNHREHLECYLGIPAMGDRHGIEVTHAWGMTETNPLGTLARATPRVR